LLAFESYASIFKAGTFSPGQVGPVSLSRQEIIQMLRRAGLADAAAAAQRSLPDPVDSKALERFCARYGLSKDSLTDRMGGSP